MKIVFVHLDLGIGGAEALVLASALALHRAGHEVWLYTSHHDQSHSFAALRALSSPSGARSAVWLIAAGAVPSEGTAHTGLWGLARSARSEALLPLGCLSASLSELLSRGPPLAEPAPWHATTTNAPTATTTRRRAGQPPLRGKSQF